MGSLTGSVVLALMICLGFGNFHHVLKVCISMFILHSAGYFLGGRLMHWVASATASGVGNGHNSVFPKLCWGMIYGLGLGAGLGYAFFTIQGKSANIATTPDSNPGRSQL